MFLPSRVTSFGRSTPATELKSGRRSMLEIMVSETWPAGILSGHEKIPGTRIPPSRVTYFEPDRGVATP